MANSLGWTLRRLRAMSPAEIRTRAMRAMRERFTPLARERPERTWARHVPSAPEVWAKALVQRLPLDAHALPAASRAAIVGEAEALLAGHSSLFGRPIEVEQPRRLRRNPLTGAEWPDLPAAAIDYRRTDLAGGIKFAWEPSRHADLLRLAQAYALTRDARFSGAAVHMWTDWIEANPRGQGIHWTSALEHAVRVLAWPHALVLLHGAPELDAARPAIGGSLLQHAEFIERHLSVGSSANNHRIGEAAALAFLGGLLPEARPARRWAAIGNDALAECALRQFHADGVNAEQAFGYLPFIWEFYLHAFRVPDARVPEAVRERLASSLAFARAATDARGWVPQVGDEDDGTVVPLWAPGAHRHAVVARALAGRLGVPGYPAFTAADDDLALQLGLVPPAAAPPTSPVAVFAEGGYGVLRDDAAGVFALLDGGPLGLGSIAAHGHADALALVLSVHGLPLLIDPGTFAYHEDPRWRDYFRGTGAHNTLRVDGRDQSEMLGPFLWGRRARAELVRGEAAGELVATHDGFAPLRHRRSVQLSGSRILVRDELTGPAGSGGRASWRWHFGPAWRVTREDGGAVMTAGPQRVTLHWAFESGAAADSAQVLRGVDDATHIAGWYSPRFSWREPIDTLEVECDARAPLRVLWTFELQPGPDLPAT